MNKDIVLVYGTEESSDHWMNERMFKRSGLDAKDYTKWFCDSHILEKLNDSKFKVAILFGEQALYDVLGRRDIMRWFNRTIELRLKDRTILVCPIIEPQRLLARRYEEDEAQHKRGMRHPPRYQGAVVEAIKRAHIKAGGDYKHSPLLTTVLKDPLPSVFNQWVEDFFIHADKDPGTFLSWDIETPYKITEDDEDEFEEDTRAREKTIIRIGAAYRVGQAVSIPWLPEYKEGIQRLLVYTGYHVGWNSVGFDVPVVEHNDIVVNGTMLDGMDAWHLYQTDLDKGLEHVSGYCTDLEPWKHLADVDPALYNGIDADAALRNLIYIKEKLIGVGLWDRYLKEMDIIKSLNDAGRRGNNIDNNLRLELKAKWEQLLYEKLYIAQGLVASEFIKYKTYKKRPKKAGKWDERPTISEVTVCSSCGKERVTIKHKCPNGNEWQKQKKSIISSVYYRTDELDGVTNLQEMSVYLKANGFNPCSSYQMMKYMRYYHHPVGTNHKTKEDSADTKHIQKLHKKYGKQHPIYHHTVGIKKLQKALSTYINGMEPDENGLIHTTYVNSPSTWRIGSRNINVQNLGKSKENEYAREARKIIIPSKDRVIIQADSASIEAVIVGHLMRDEKYIIEARKGIHAGLTCKWLGIPPTPENRAKVKKETIYLQLKKMNHATNYGMGPYLAYMTYPDEFPTLNDAKRLQQFIFTELPMLPKWHHELRMTAQKNGYLDNPWGLRHYFYDVFSYAHDEDGKLIFGPDGLPKIKLGKDGKRVIAFKPQSSAGFIMRDNVYLINQTEARDWMPAVFSIHDGYSLDVPYHQQDTAINILGEILTRPIMEMDGLRIGAEIEIMEQNFLDGKVVKVIEI